MADLRHLHRDYHTAWCGAEAMLIPMTYEPKETTCKECKAAHRAATTEENARAREATKLEAEWQRHNAKVQREHDKHRARRAARLGSS